jgi:hypothetical protein
MDFVCIFTSICGKMLAVEQREISYIFWDFPLFSA